MKVEVWLMEWTADHQTGYHEDDEPHALLIEQVVAKDILVYECGRQMCDLGCRWPTGCRLDLSGFMVLRLTGVEPELWDYLDEIFLPEERLWGTNRDQKHFFLGPTELELHLATRITADKREQAWR